MTETPTNTSLSRTPPRITILALLAWVSSGFLHAETLTELIYLSEFGSAGSQAGQFKSPWGLAVDSRDRIIVTDVLNHRIQICDESGTCVTFGQQGAELGQFNYPQGIDLNAQGEIIVADTYNNRVQICDSSGDCRFLADAQGEARVFDNPQDVAVDNMDQIIVTEPKQDRYHVCIDRGDCQTVTDIEGEPNSFNRPLSVAVLPDGKIVLMTTQWEIWICDDQGDCEKSFGSRGDGPGQFSDPGEILVDDRGWIIVADKDNSRIQFCDQTGNCEAFILHKTAAQLDWWPTGLGLDSHGHLVIADQRGHHVQIYDVTQIEGPAIPINFSMNDAWYDPGMPGQGFLVNVFDDLTQRLFLAWFTFDLERPDSLLTANVGEPGHRWLTAQGIYHTYTATLDIHLSEGGRFLNPTPETVLSKYGEMTIRFSDCAHGTIHFDIPSTGRIGEIPIERLAPDSEILCQEFIK